MATYDSKTILVLASNGNGAAVSIQDNDGKYVELSAAFDATIGFELSFDGGTVWREVQSLIAAGGFFVDEPATHIRAVTSSYVSGDPVALIRVTQ